MNSSSIDHLFVDPEEMRPELMNALTTNHNGSDTPPQELNKYVSNSTAFWFEVLIYALLCGCISIFGIAANVINIIVFLRQGVLTDNGNVTLLGLSVSDLFCVITMLWLSVTYSFVVADPQGLSWDPWEIYYLTAGWPHLMCAQITRMITAYLAFERCVCVVFPFKVKFIFTPRRSIVVIVGIFICFGLSFSPVFIMQQLQFRTDPSTNTTRLVMVSSPHWRLAVDVMYYINSITFNVGSVAIVLVCTVITVSRVNLSKSWRESMSAGNSLKPETTQKLANSDDCRSHSVRNDTKDNFSNHEGKSQSNQTAKLKLLKEKRLVRMLTFISVISLICYIPDLTFLVMLSVNKEIRIKGSEENLCVVMYAFTFLMQTINSTINIIVYYKMSSRYKKEFRALFGLTETN